MSADGTLSTNTSIQWNVSLTNNIDYLSIVADNSGNIYYTLTGGQPIYHSDRTLYKTTTANTISLIKINSTGFVQWLAEFQVGAAVALSMRLTVDFYGNVILALPLTQISDVSQLAIKNSDGTPSGYVLATGGKSAATFVVRYDSDGNATDCVSLACCGANLSIDTDNQNALYLHTFYTNFESTITAYTFNGLVQNSYTRQDTSRDTQFLLKLSADFTPLWMFTMTGFLFNPVSVTVTQGGNAFLTLVHSVNRAVNITDSDSLILLTNTNFIINNSNNITVSDPTLANLNTFLSDNPGVTMLSISSGGKYNWATTIKNVQSNFGAFAAVDVNNQPYMVCAITSNLVVNIIGMTPNSFTIPLVIPSTGTHTMIIKLQNTTGTPIWTTKLLGSYLLTGVSVDDHGNIAVGTLNNTNSWEIVNADGSSPSLSPLATMFSSVTSFDVNTGAFQWGIALNAATPTAIGFKRGTRAVAVAINMVAATSTSWFGVPTVSTSEKIVLFNIPAYGGQQGSGGTVVAKNYATVSIADNSVGVIFANQANDDVIIFGNKADTQKVLVGLSNSSNPAAITITGGGVAIPNLQVNNYNALLASLSNVNVSQQLSAATVFGLQGNYSNVHVYSNINVNGKIISNLMEVANIVVNSNIVASNHVITAGNVVCTKLVLGTTALTFG